MHKLRIFTLQVQSISVNARESTTIYVFSVIGNLLLVKR